MGSKTAKSNIFTRSGTRDELRKPSPFEHWSEREIDEPAFKDARLGRRFGELLKQIGDGMGESIPYACQDWANTKAAYRFLANKRVGEGDNLSGHFAATRARCDASDGPILLIQDTTEFSYQRANVSAVGVTKSVNSGRDKRGRVRHHTVCGMLMHSSLAVTTREPPLGLAAVKFWTRKKFRGTKALKRKINPTRVPIEKKESVRWLDNLRPSIERLGQPERFIHIGDRESDIYELYCLTRDLGSHFLVRACVDRLAGDSGHTIADEMEETGVKGLHHIEVRDEEGEVTKVALEIKFRRIVVLPPIGKQKRYPALELAMIHAAERGAPKGRKPIEWKLITDLPVRGRAEAIEKINWYAMRWQIEMFHKVLKSGCKAEESKLRAAELTGSEIVLLDRLVSDAGNRRCKPSTLSFYLTKLARLGGYLARARAGLEKAESGGDSQTARIMIHPAGWKGGQPEWQDPIRRIYGNAWCGLFFPGSPGARWHACSMSA